MSLRGERRPLAASSPSGIQLGPSSRLLVCFKQVPETSARLGLRPGSLEPHCAGVLPVVNPYDEFALEQALLLRDALGGGEVLLLTLAAEPVDETVFHGLAMGAERSIVLRLAPGTRPDPLASARILAEAIVDLAPDVVFCGELAVDDGAAQTGPAMAELLGWPQICGAESIVARDGGSLLRACCRKGETIEIVECTPPCVVTFIRGRQLPRYPSLDAIFTAGAKPVDGRLVPRGSTSNVTRRLSLAAPLEKRGGEIVPGAEALLERVARAIDVLEERREVQSRASVEGERSRDREPELAAGPRSTPSLAGALGASSHEGAVIAVVERRGGHAAKASLEALAQARRMADELGTRLWAVTWGADAACIAPELEGSGAGHVLVVGGAASEAADAVCFVATMEDAIRRLSPRALFFAGTHWGRERAARLSARLGAALAMDVTGWRLGAEDAVVVQRPVYGGRMVEDLELCGRPAILCLRPNLFGLDPVRAASPAHIEELPEPGLSARMARIVDVIAGERERTSLAEAQVIVSGGKGVGGPAGFELLRELAEALGGVVGASRAAVDAGWMPPDRQVGQTGTVVSPKLYIACGISGAVQHRAGIRDARFIAAINNNPEAPIFRFANIGVVGDLFEVVPRLTETVRQRRRESGGSAS